MVPDAFAGLFGVLLFSAGHGARTATPSCAPSRAPAPSWPRPGVRVAGLSVDDEATTTALIARHGLTFPVGYGADAHAIAALTGAFANPDPVCQQPRQSLPLACRRSAWLAESAAVRSG
jgi:hypothetical protein